MLPAICQTAFAAHGGQTLGVKVESAICRDFIAASGLIGLEDYEEQRKSYGFERLRNVHDGTVGSLFLTAPLAAPFKAHPHQIYAYQNVKTKIKRYHHISRRTRRQHDVLVIKGAPPQCGAGAVQ